MIALRELPSPEPPSFAKATEGRQGSSPKAEGPIALFERIGRDHALNAVEIPSSAQDAAVLRRMWAAYERHWRRFCGARLDPQFSALDHPARRTGALVAGDGAPIVVLGTGPSLRRSLPELRLIRDAVHIITSPRGADALDQAGMTPDVVLVEHQTALDAHFSMRDLSHRRTDTLSHVPWLAADARTPAALLTGLSTDRLFVPDPLPTWGLWPATAVALAIAAGARLVAILGIDLGSDATPDPAQAPLQSLLEVLAAHANVPCLDIGAGGAAKKHWFVTPLNLLAGTTRQPLALISRPWTTAAARHARSSAIWERTAPLAYEAAATISAARTVRDGAASPDSMATLERAFDKLLAAGGSHTVRQDLQDGLGLSFLPRFWRTRPDAAIGPQLWRPAAMAAHELRQQHRALDARLRRSQ